MQKKICSLKLLYHLSMLVNIFVSGSYFAGPKCICCVRSLSFWYNVLFVIYIYIYGTFDFGSRYYFVYISVSPKFSQFHLNALIQLSLIIIKAILASWVCDVCRENTAEYYYVCFELYGMIF